MLWKHLEETMKIKKYLKENKITEAEGETVYIMVAGGNSKVFRNREDAEARSKRFNYNVEMSGSSSGYSRVVETTLQ